MKERVWQALRFLGLYAGLVGLWWVVKAAHENFSQEWMAWGLPLFVLLGALAIWKGPQWQTRHLAGQGVEPKDRHQLADANRRTIMQMLGGVFLIVGVYNTLGTLNVAREGQITDRFAKAIELLGSADENSEPQMVLRLGAIYSLERIARDSPRDHWTVMEVLTEDGYPVDSGSPKM